LRARAALGVSVGEQQSHYSDTEQNKTDRAHGFLLPVSCFVRRRRYAGFVEPQSSRSLLLATVRPILRQCQHIGLGASSTMRQRAAVFGRERHGEF
jgi:hypothetical protein